MLDSYSVDAFTVDQETARFYNRIDHVQPTAAEEANLTVELGCRYPNGAIVPIQGVAAVGKGFENPLSPSGTAGSRFPNVTLIGDDRQVSTLDLIKQNLVLAVTEPNSPWIEAANAVTMLPIDSYALNESSDPLQDVQGTLRTKCKLGEGESLLVRSDGFIAWRGEFRNGRHLDALNAVLQEILGR